MAKLTLTDYGSSYASIQALNANNTKIENALEVTLSRDGTTPNQMEAVLDMNSNRIINLPEPEAPTDAARLIDVASQVPTVQAPADAVFVSTTATLLSLFGADIVVPANTLIYTAGRSVQVDGGGGYFYYNSSDTTTPDNGGTIRVDAADRRWYALRQAWQPGFSVKLFGAIGDGTTPDDDALADALDALAGTVIYFPEGIYKVSTGGPSLIIQSGTTLIGCSKDKSIIHGLDDAGGSSYIMGAIWSDPQSNIVIKNLGFSSTSADQCAIVITGPCDNWLIENCHADKVGLVHTDASGDVSYSGVTDGNSPSNIIVRDCTGLGTAGTYSSQFAFIGLFYCNYWQVLNCSAEYFHDGIVWWGGDADYNVNGNPNNTRKCHDGLIVGCSFKNIFQGGIWGSMGHRITVNSSSAENCDDVCLDAEGCQEVSFNNCRAKDGANGSITSFWCNRDVAFNNCDVTNTSSTIMFRIYNATGDASLNDSVTIDGGTWCHTTSTGLIDDSNGPCFTINIRNLKLLDVVIAIDGTQGHETVIDNVNSFFSRDIPAGYGSGAIVVANPKIYGSNEAKSVIRDCVVHSSATQTNTTRAIAMANGNTDTNDNIFMVIGSRTSGFTTDILLVDNAGRARYFLGNNLCRSKTITVSGLNGSSTLSKWNNYGFDNTSL